MIRDDFKNGGFPICRRCPVFCYTDEGGLFVVYNNYDLHVVLVGRPVVKCVGVWPGKVNTDVFPLDVKVYKSIPPPPKGDRGIDNAEQIDLILDKKHQGAKRIEWVIRDSDGNASRHTSDDPALADYVVKAKRRHRVIYD